MRKTIAAVALIAAVLTITTAAFASVSPTTLAGQIDRINHATLGYPASHTVCHAYPGHPGKAICTVNLGKPNTTITVAPFDAQCWRGEFWNSGTGLQTIHIQTQTVVQVPCTEAPAPRKAKVAPPA